MLALRQCDRWRLSPLGQKRLLTHEIGITSLLVHDLNRHYFERP